MHSLSGTYPSHTGQLPPHISPSSDSALSCDASESGGTRANASAALDTRGALAAYAALSQPSASSALAAAYGLSCGDLIGLVGYTLHVSSTQMLHGCLVRMLLDRTACGLCRRSFAAHMGSAIAFFRHHNHPPPPLRWHADLKPTC